MIAIGIGCRRHCTVADIVALVEEALDVLPRPARPAAIFTLAEKIDEAGLVEAAARLGLPLHGLEHAALRLAAGRARHGSPRIEAMFGLPGIAETAALAGAGPDAVLLVPRRASAVATCAIAGPAL